MGPVSLFKQIAAVLIGGSVGSLLRFGFSYWIQRQLANSFFPWGILTVNLAGCFAIGVLVAFLFEYYQLGPIFRAAIIIGFLGGFTTFSSFTLDTVTLLQSNEYVAALLYLGLSVGGGILATFLGLTLVRVLV